MTVVFLAELQRVTEPTHSFSQQLLAGLPDALESLVHILLAGQTVDAVIQGMRHSLGHLEHTAGSQ